MQCIPNYVNGYTCSSFAAQVHVHVDQIGVCLSGMYHVLSKQPQIESETFKRGCVFTRKHVFVALFYDCR